MSKKPSKRSKKETEIDQSATTDVDVTEQNEDIEETHESLQREPRTININLESYQNIIGFFPIADIQTHCSYCDTIIGSSTTIPVTDDEFLPINESFSFEVDINSPREIDQLISSPAILTVFQEKGTFNPDIYQQLQINEAVIATSTKSFDSIVSLYEAFTDHKIDSKLLDPKSESRTGRKAKKAKSEKPPKKVEEKPSRASSKTSGKGRKSQSLKETQSGSALEPLVKTVEDPQVYGICAIDFLPLFQGEKSFSETMLIKPIKVYKDEKMNSYKAHPKIIITVSINEELNLTNGVMMNFTLESIYNIPQLMKPDMDYKICHMVSLNETLKVPILFTNPKHTTENCEALNRCWPGMQRIGLDANTTKYRVSTDNENIFCKFEDDIIPYLGENSPKLEFNMIKRHLFDRGALVEFASNVKTYRKIVLEFLMTGKSGKQSSLNVAQDGSFKDKSTAKMTSDKGSEKWSMKKLKHQPYLHLMAVVDISSLLYPGVTRVRVASPLTTFSPEEALKYGGLEDSYFLPSDKKEAKDITSKELLSKKDKSKVKENKSSKSSKSSKKGGKKDTSPDKDMKRLLPPKPELLPEPEPSEPVFNEDGKPCFVIVEIELSKPIIPKREIKDVKEEIHQLLQKKIHPSPKIVLSNCLTKEYYKEVLNDIIEDMNDKFQRFLEENPNYRVRSYKTPSDFVKFLQTIGSYQPYLTSITKAATLLVTNHFKCDNAMEKKNTQLHQNFIGKVFIHLISEMNSTVNKLVSHGMQPLPKEVVSNEMFLYAKEALELTKTSVAERYFLRVLCSDKNNADYWFDYAVYYLETKEEDKAYECLQEALLKNANHNYSILLFAILLDRKGQKEEAESCFLNLMVQEPKWLEAWGILYIFYRKYEKYEGMDVAIEMAKKLLDDIRKPTSYFDEFEDLAWTPKICPRTVFFRTAILLVKMRVYNWAEMALSEEMKKNYGLVNYLLSAICYYRKLYSHALEHIEETKEHYGSDYAVAALSGHCLLALNKKEEAKKEYYHVLESFGRPDNIHLVYINCARILEHMGDDQEARKLILLACKFKPTPYTWLKAGLLYFQENDLLSAEECFNEGNLIDHRHPELWGNLCLVNLKLNRPFEAELCYQQLLNNHLEDEDLLETIRVEFEKLKHPVTSS
ncbi:unnamed protein product [Phaedon cochleariae]|uniref:Uncharacterized protein n=1 Tax=Phaedon cochleariae TaxID=80249 RepID=A0A9N9X4N5_PHACE|nr:unnamed protein product [Phaedon cochleariae]